MVFRLFAGAEQGQITEPRMEMRHQTQTRALSSDLQHSKTNTVQLRIFKLISDDLLSAITC